MRFSVMTPALALCIGLSLCEASDRIKVISPPAGQAVAEALVGSLATACNAGDFIGFMDHFSASHAAKIRTRMEGLFISHQPKIDIQKVTLLSEGADEIAFGVRYELHDDDKPQAELSSKVVARRVNGAWKLDGEQVRAINRRAQASGYAGTGAGVAPPAWDPFNPPAQLIDPRLEHLRGDIGIQPGAGCANGRCRQ
jgi:hypothetical protein